MLCTTSKATFQILASSVFFLHTTTDLNSIDNIFREGITKCSNELFSTLIELFTEL